MSQVPVSQVEVSPPPPQVRIPFAWRSEATLPGPNRLWLSGELDLGDLEELGRALAAAEHPTRGLIVNIAELDYIDCAAIGYLFRTAERLSRSGRRLVLIGAQGQAARVFGLTGTPTGTGPAEDVKRPMLAVNPIPRTSERTIDAA